MNDAMKRAVRTSVQLIAGGGLTGVVAALAAGLTQQQTATVMAVMTLVVTFCQNYAEDAGWIKPLLK